MMAIFNWRLPGLTGVNMLPISSFFFWGGGGDIQFDANLCLILQDFPLIVHCLGWCHI